MTRQMSKIDNPPINKPVETTGNKPLSTQQQLVAQAAFNIHQGPLPSPEILIRYNEAVPDAANRVIVMAENQAAHRQNLERKVIESDIKNSRTGLHYGLIIGLTTVIGAVICITNGHDVAGTIFGSAGLSSLVGVFVYGSRQKMKERESRIEQIENMKKQQSST